MRELRGNDGTVLYLDCDSITLHICQTQNYTPEKSEFYSM